MLSAGFDDCLFDRGWILSEVWFWGFFNSGWMWIAAQQFYNLGHLKLAPPRFKTRG